MSCNRKFRGNRDTIVTRQWLRKLARGLVPWEAMSRVTARRVEANTASHGVKPRVSHWMTDALREKRQSGNESVF